MQVLGVYFEVFYEIESWEIVLQVYDKEIDWKSFCRSLNNKSFDNLQA